MGAIPFTSKLLEREKPTLSPNLDLARRMMNRSDSRRRGGKFEPIKIQFDHILEERESPAMKEEDSSLGSRTSDASVDLQHVSPYTSFYMPADSINELTPAKSQHSLAQTLHGPYPVHARKELVSSSTQTDTESTGTFPVTENTCAIAETASISIKTETTVEFSCTPLVQYFPIQTAFESNSDEKTSSSILIQTDYSEDTGILENTSVSTQTERNEIFDSFSLQYQTLQTVADTYTDASAVLATTFQSDCENELLHVPSPVVPHESCTLTGTDIPLHQSDTGPNISIYIQTEDIDTSHLAHHVQTVDTPSSPFIVSTHSAPTQFPETECYPSTINSSIQTDYIYRMTLDVSMQTEQEASIPLTVPIHSLECWVQTDNNDVITSEVSASTCVQTDEAEVEAVQRQSVFVQTNSDECQARPFIKISSLSPTSSYENISAAQSQTEIEITEILNEPSSLPIESSESSIDNRFENFIVRTTNSSVQTENIQHYYSATVTDSAKDHRNSNSTQTEFHLTTDRETEAKSTNLAIFDKSEVHNETHNESIIFSLSEKICEIEATNEELILDLEYSSISNHKLMRTQNDLKGILTNIINEDITVETSHRLIDSIESSEISSLLETLLDCISRHRDEEQLKEVSPSPNEAIEEIKSMVSNWSEADIQQLPHYLLTVKTEMQRLNTIIESKDSSLSKLKSQLHTDSSQQSKSGVDEEVLVEFEHLKSNNQLLEAQLSQSEVKIREYASILSEQQDEPETADTSVMTDDTVVFSVEKCNQIDDKLREINNTQLSQVVDSRRRVGVEFQILKPLETLVGLSNILPFLDLLSEILRLYLNDLNALSGAKEQMEQHREAYISIKEENLRLRTGMEHLQSQLDSEKILRKKAQSNVNTAMDEITDLFKANDLFEQQIKQAEEETEKRRIVWQKEQSLMENKLQEADKIIEEKELLICQANSVATELRNEVASVHDHYSDYFEREQVQATANRVVELERDIPSLQRDNQNLMATRSHLESNILHLKTQIEMDRLERISLKQDHTRQHEQQEQELCQLREHQYDVQNYSSEIGGLKENIKSLEVSLKASREEAQMDKSNCENNQDEFNKLLTAFRTIKKKHLHNIDELLPEMSLEINNLEAENTSLKESLSNSKTGLTEALTKLKYYESGDSVNHLPDDKLSVSQLQSKCNSQQRRITFLEDQCRNIEKRRKLEVSSMPKHDFLSLRADKASLKAQARVSTKAPPLFHTDNHSVENVPLETENHQSSTEVPPECNNQ